MRSSPFSLNLGFWSLFLPLLHLLPFFSLSLPAVEIRVGEEIQVTGTFSDNLYASGGEIMADVAAMDDVFMAGGKIDFRGRTRESLFMAAGQLHLQQGQAEIGVLSGGDVILTHTQFRELIVAGGQVEIDDTRIADDMVVAAGRLTLGQGTHVQGHAQLAGGQVEVRGRVEGDAILSGAEVRISGTFQGHVRVNANKLKVAPQTVIQGNLIHSTDRLDLSPEARIGGRIKAIPPAQRGLWQGPDNLWKGVFGLGTLLFFLGTLLISPIISLLFPRTMEQGRREFTTRFWENLGKGFFLTLAIPFLTIFLLTTVLGTPLGLASLPFTLILLLLACSMVAHLLGQGLRHGLKLRKLPPEQRPPLRPRENFWWTMLGQLLVNILLWIPLLGALSWIIVFLACMGSLFNAGRAALSRTAGHTSAGPAGP